MPSIARPAALPPWVVVAPAGAPLEPNALADEEIDHLEARGEKHLAACPRRCFTDVADDVVEIRHAILVRIGYALRKHQGVVRQPHHAARQSGRATDECLLLDDQRLDPRIDCRQRRRHPAATAARDQEVDGLVPIHHVRVLKASGIR
jgi:hypothetical protein